MIQCNFCKQDMSELPEHRTTFCHKPLCVEAGTQYSETWKRRAEKGFDEIIRLNVALRAAGNAIGTPVPSYYTPEMQLKYYKARETSVANIIVAAVKK